MFDAIEPSLLVCIGKDCARANGHSQLVELADEVERAVSVGCQGNCNGAIVGVWLGDKVRWYSRMTSSKRKERLIRSVKRGRFDKNLSKREIKKYRNTIRKRRQLRRM